MTVYSTSATGRAAGSVLSTVLIFYYGTLAICAKIGKFLREWDSSEFVKANKVAPTFDVV